ncbi:MAG: SRPBCC family protein [Ignavibacteriales bacterium]|nr:SRPBCC family protein [Ignavibacteriales bacterium]
MKKQRKIKTEVYINASKEQVWEILFTRFGETHLYNPNLESSHFVSSNKGEVGCERQCDFDPKTRVVERITKSVELKSFSIDIVGGNMPFMETGLVEVELKSINSNQTKVNFTMNFVSKPAFMGLMMKGMMKKKLTDVLIGLKYYLETGNTVSKKTYGPVYKAYKQLGEQQPFSYAVN